MEDICKRLTWIRVKYCSALWRDLAWDKCDREAALALSGGRFVLRYEGQRERMKIDHIRCLLSRPHTPHFFSLYPSVSCFPFVASPYTDSLTTTLLSFSAGLLCSLSEPQSLPLSLSVVSHLHVFSQPINSVYVRYVLHMNIRLSWCFPCTNGRPGTSPRIYLSLRSALLYGGSSKNRGQYTRREGTETGFLWRMTAACMCVMDAPKHNVSGRVYPSICGVEPWQSVRVCKSVFHSVSVYRWGCVYLCVRRVSSTESVFKWASLYQRWM